jgi:HAD superfamily hydrolase (TIGR01450 family)
MYSFSRITRMFQRWVHAASGIIDAEAASAAIQRSLGILLDWDGCTATANRPRADALAFIAKHRTRIAIISNNSTQLPAEISGILQDADIELPPTRIFLAGTEALAMAARTPAARALVIGSSRMKAWARNRGLSLTQSDANLVVLLRDTRFSYVKLERAVRALNAGARLIVSNTDRSHPGPDGAIVPETGALLAAIGTCVDLSKVETQVVGKPSPTLYEQACTALGIPIDAAVMVGDNRLTDIEGADRLGMTSVLVAPGSGLTFDRLLGGVAPAERHVARRRRVAKTA